MADSINKKLDRVRPPRVHISYDVHTGDAMETKELPFVMGILADLSGNPATALPKLSERKFVEVTPDNFDTVLKKMTPRVAFRVTNQLAPGPDAGKLAVDLTFTSLDDFSPEQVARNVPALKELLDLRTKLANLRGSLQGNDKLDDILKSTISDAKSLDKLKSEVSPTAGGSRE